MLETLYSTGIGRMQPINVGLTGIDADRGTLMVRLGTGKKDLMIPTGDRALAWIGQYRDDVRPELAIGQDDGTLFLTTLGEGFVPNRMTQLVCGYVNAAHIGQERVVPSVPAYHGDAHCGERGRHPVHPGHAWPCRAIDYPDLHPGLHPHVEADS